ncbi:MAG TPA: ATP-binding protein [Bryobacteraceae bacterium]
MVLLVLALFPTPANGASSRATNNGSPAPVILSAKLHYGSPLFGYILALALISVTGVVRMALMERGYSVFPFVFFYPALALASFLGGVGPGLASTVMSAIFAFFFFPYATAPMNWIALAILGPLSVQGFAHLRDIVERNRAIAHELVNFKFISDHASDWILLLNESGQIQYINLKASQDLGWPEEDLTGRNIESLVPESQRPILTAALAQAKSGTGKLVELAFERRDKSLALMELGCTGVRTEKDYVIYASARDIGERKQIEKQLQEIRYWESLGALAGGLAHDFNNLLTSILGNSSLAKDIIPPAHEAAPLLEGIMSSAERSSDLVRMLLATAGYRSRYSEPLQLDELLDWTLANRTLPINVRIEREVAETTFMGDRRAFETLFWSLISNAAEAYGPGGGDVRVAIRFGPAPPKRPISFEEGDAGDGQCLGIVVEDRGSGMSAQVLKRAFDPFFSTKFTGRGLGLPAVRGIVRAYSGKLLLETAVGQGTRVEIWLPVSKS